MAIRNRNTLIEGFSKGQRPTADDFKNLIDSTVNILDDGFSKDAQSGIKLAPISDPALLGLHCSKLHTYFLSQLSFRIIMFDIIKLYHMVL